MFPIKFGVKRSMVQCIDHRSRKRFSGSKTLPVPPRVTISHICTTQGRKISLSNLGSICQRSSALTSKCKYAFQALECYPFHLGTPYQTCRLHMEGSCFLSNLVSKGQRSSALDIEVENSFPGSRVLSFPLRDTKSQIWTTHEKKGIKDLIEPFLYPFRKEVLIPISLFKSLGYAGGGVVGGGIFLSISYSSPSYT
jgi:hypothetical protein